MEVRYADQHETVETPRYKGKILLFIASEYSVDAAVTLEALLELRAEIDKFLFTRLGHTTGSQP